MKPVPTKIMDELRSEQGRYELSASVQNGKEFSCSLGTSLDSIFDYWRNQIETRGRNEPVSLISMNDRESDQHEMCNWAKECYAKAADVAKKYAPGFIRGN